MKKILAFLLILTVVFSAMSLSAFANTAETGLSFNAESLYKTQKPLTSGIPYTFEARIKMESSDEAGVIVGNNGASVGYFSFEIDESGRPTFLAKNVNATRTFNFKFTDVDVRTGEWINLAVVFTSGKKGYCYINGELKQTISWTTAEVNAGTVDKEAVLGSTAAYPSAVTSKERFVVGGDLRTGNTKYFHGKISSLKIYQDSRSATEVAGDFSSELDKSGLLAAYKLEPGINGANPAVIEDLSGNGYDFYYNDIWINEAPKLDDYAYSFAVLGDTQEANLKHPDCFSGIYNWILENAEKYNTKFVFGLGDITDTNTDAEWERAVTEINKLDGYLLYSIIRGNHDSQAKFNKYFPFSEYGDNVSGSMEGNMLNTYQKFNVGNVKYLVLNLDVGAPDNVLEWANEVVAANPDRNVIVTTHGYLYRGGSPIVSTDNVPIADYAKVNDVKVTGNNGDEMWDEFIKKHENIVLVLSGHIACDSVVTAQTAGENGNIVTQMLIDPQGNDSGEEGGAGLVAMLHFSEDGKNVQLRYYSTAKKAYYLTENQYSFTMDMIEPVIVAPEISLSNISFKVNLKGDDIKGKIIAALYDGEYNLSESIIYDAAETVDVTFTKNTADSKIKIMWWDGMDTLVPMTIPGVTSIETN